MCPKSGLFADMRLDEDESTRAPFELRELQAMFAASVLGERPNGGQGKRHSGYRYSRCLAASVLANSRVSGSPM